MSVGENPSPQPARRTVPAATPNIRRWIFGLAFAAALIPAVFLTIVVQRYAVDVPYYDEWGMTGLIRKSIRGTLRFEDFFAQYSGHRLVFPKLLLLATARITGWDTRYELAINLVLGYAIAGAFVMRATASAVAFRSQQCLLLVPLFSLMSLSLSQYENWMWGWQSTIFLAVFGSSAALLLLSGSRLGYGRLALAMVLAVIATFSFANGMLTWPLGLLALLYPGLRDTPPRRVFAGIWVVAAISVFTAYFYNFAMSPDEQQGEPGAAPLFGSLEYLCAYFGAPFVLFNVKLAVPVGAFGLLLSFAVAAYLILARSVRPIAYLPGALLWLFGLGSGLLTAFGRAGFGTTQALSSRYVTISHLFWIGTFMMFAALCFAPGANGTRTGSLVRGARAAFLVVVTLAAAATIRSDVAGIESVRQFSHLERMLRFKLLQGHMDDQMLLLAPDLKWLETWKNMAQEDRFWAWRPNAPASMFEMPPPLDSDGLSDPESQFRLGVAYAKGDEVPLDYAKAFEAWSKAADQGHAAAQYNLALMYARGVATVRDDQKAAEWYAKAAEVGFAAAQFGLGEAYADGIGVARDEAKAYTWFYIAAVQGYEGASLKRDEVRARLTPEQLESAQLAATDWLKKHNAL